ncbi:MAG: class I SAM-dependent DNA methyltransferase [Planctomycetes bacterium]|nr:class I SAM-dependent DNA methyltransferase [Planctomycetota bacterium]
MTDERAARLKHFVEWTRQHITGDEKGQAQIYLDRLFQAFGRPGLLEVGGTPEFRIKQPTEDGGGTSFADYVWKPVVLIEMKKRGTVLARHTQQALNYWFRLVPNRPEFVILCNFDEFRIYDFNVDINEPQDVLALDDLPNRYGPLAFLFPTDERPRFEIDRLKVTRQAADKLATCYSKLAQRKKIGPELAQRFILQMLVALFSEDIGLLPKYFVADLIKECTDPPKAFDLLGGLFNAMATKDGSRGGRFKAVPYFNGGIFAQPAPIELLDDEVSQLKRAVEYDWSHVSPDIFGTIFQHSMNAEERHALGAHYTAPIDIMKIVRPTIVEPWENLIENASTAAELHKLRDRIGRFTVLDPACGSGNFLYLAYRELKRLETRLIERIQQKSPKDAGQRFIGHVTSKQFYGMDIIPFAVELAKVTMTLAHKLVIDELHVDEAALPLDNLDANIQCIDALIDQSRDREGAGSVPTKWPACDVIIGNPPFLGAKRLKPERGPDYVNAVRAAYPDVPGMADYCVYWFRRTHDHLKNCTPEDPVAGRAGLVGTQNIRNNQSRVGGLDHIVKTGVIVEAVDNQPWSGEANVHVSIVNWVKTQQLSRNAPGSKHAEMLIPATRKLWQKADTSLHLFPDEDDNPSRDHEGAGSAIQSRDRKGAGSQRLAPVRTPGKRKGERKDKSYELEVHECASINSALSSQTDVSTARILKCNTEPQRVFQGQAPGHEGFYLTFDEADEMVRSDKRNKQVLYPFLNGRELVTGDGKPTRIIIDFQDVDINKASTYEIPFARIKKSVLPDREKKAKIGKSSSGELRPHHQQFLRYWWRHSFDRPEMISWINRLPRYICCSIVTKRPIFIFMHPQVRPSNLLEVFAFEDDYSFGVLQSGIHWLWFTTKCSKLAERYRYTPPTVFDMFPWPQAPTKKQINAVAAAGREIRRIRAATLPNITGGLRALYRTLELPGKNPLKEAHAALDAAVLDAYGFKPDADLLKQLLDLNLAVAAKIDRQEPVTAPGIPPTYGDPKPLITDDCIMP